MRTESFSLETLPAPGAVSWGSEGLQVTARAACSAGNAQQRLPGEVVGYPVGASQSSCSRGVGRVGGSGCAGSTHSPVSGCLFWPFRGF